MQKWRFICSLDSSIWLALMVRGGGDLLMRAFFNFFSSELCLDQMFSVLHLLAEDGFTFFLSQGSFFFTLQLVGVICNCLNSITYNFCVRYLQQIILLIEKRLIQYVSMTRIIQIIQIMETAGTNQF